MKVPGFRSKPNLRSFVLGRMKHICRITSENINYLESNNEMKKRTFIVRYEDIAIKPFEYAKRIFNFTGMNFTSEVSDWISKNTKSKKGPQQNLA